MQKGKVEFQTCGVGTSALRKMQSTNINLVETCAGRYCALKHGAIVRFCVCVELMVMNELNANGYTAESDSGIILTINMKYC